MKEGAVCGDILSKIKVLDAKTFSKVMFLVLCCLDCRNFVHIAKYIEIYGKIRENDSVP